MKNTKAINSLWIFGFNPNDCVKQAIRVMSAMDKFTREISRNNWFRDVKTKAIVRIRANIVKCRETVFLKSLPDNTDIQRIDMRILTASLSMMDIHIDHIILLHKCIIQLEAFNTRYNDIVLLLNLDFLFHSA